MKNFDVNSFQEQLRAQPWQLVFDKDDINDAVKVWEDLFLEVINAHMPIRNKRVKNKSSPWMCAEIMALINERDKFKDKARKVKITLLKETLDSKRKVLKKNHEELFRLCQIINASPIYLNHHLMMGFLCIFRQILSMNM